MADTFKFDLGAEARDRVTGYRGVITARCQHLTGCNTYGVMRKADDKGEIADPHWFDEQRIALVLRRVDGLEIPQIAEYMGLSVSTVKRRLKLAEALLERTRER